METLKEIFLAITGGIELTSLIAYLFWGFMPYRDWETDRKSVV